MNEVYENLKKMSELNDSIHKAEQNALISLEDYCSDLVKPQKPKKKKQCSGGLQRESA